MSCVYWLFNADDEVIYIGRSTTMATRLSGHESRTGWWSEVERIEVEHHDSLASASAREVELIRSLTPKHNTLGTAEPTRFKRPPGRPAGLRLVPEAFDMAIGRRNATASLVAKESGVSQSHISNMRSGRGGATPDVARRIAATLGVSEFDLFTERAAA
jgi:predicted GIY-YIG superfamily endonuclease